MEKKIDLETVAEVIRGLYDDPEQITADMKLMDDLSFDDLDMVELAMALEEEFGIEIPDEDCEKWKTVGDVVGCLKKICGEK